MRFYTKIFITFLGLLTITSHVVVGADVGENIICSKNNYIEQCEFDLTQIYTEDTNYMMTHQNQPPYNTADPATQKLVLQITPEYIFALLASFAGVLCWDFDDPQKNYENLRKFFHPTDEDSLECYSVQSDNIVKQGLIIITGQRPAGTKVSIYPITYLHNSERIMNACDWNSIPQTPSQPEKPSYCQPCPRKNNKAGRSKGASFLFLPPLESKWDNFTTIADCHYWDDAVNYQHEDNTGWFEYSLDFDGTNSLPDNGACYYSGE